MPDLGHPWRFKARVALSQGSEWPSASIRDSAPASSTGELGIQYPPSMAAESDELCWLAHGRYLLKGLGKEPFEVFEVGHADVAPQTAPGSSEEAIQQLWGRRRLADARYRYACRLRPRRKREA